MDKGYSSLVRRAALPEVMFIPDLALALQLSLPAARRSVLQGRCGPYHRVGRRLVVLRENLLAALSGHPEGPSRGGTDPQSADELGGRRE